MKVFMCLLIISVAAVCSLPLEEKSENENLNVLANFEAEPAEADVNFVDDLVRDKRQYGGNKKNVCCEVWTSQVQVQCFFLNFFNWADVKKQQSKLNELDRLH